MSPLSSFLPRAFHSLGRRPLLIFALFAGLGGILFLARGPQQEAEGSVGRSAAYDDEGQLVRTTDAAGRITQFILTKPDKRGWHQRIRKLPDGSEVAEELDTLGRRRYLTDSAGTTRYVFDDLGRLSSVNREGAAALAYTYDSQGRVKAIKVTQSYLAEESFEVCYRYDFLGRRTEIQTPLGVFSTEYRRDADGLPMTVQRFPGGVRSERRTNKEGRLLSLTHIGADGQRLAHFVYEYRPDGLISRVREQGRGEEVVVTYLYDNVQRLASVVDSRHGTLSYHYDLVGNRTETVAAGQAPVMSRFDWAGRLVEHRGAPCKHDPAGNLTEWTSDHGRLRCGFSAEGALAEVEAPAGTIRYVHDGDGQLVARESGSSRTTFTADPQASAWHPLAAEEYDGRIATVFDTGYSIPALKRRTFFVWDGDVLLAAVTRREAEIYLTDHLGSARVTLDAQGKLLRRMDYDPFGVPRQKQTGKVLQPGFAGLFYDPDASLYLAQARAYEPTLGRFLQPDPIHHIPFGSQKDLTAYVYCGSDPVNYVDLDGRSPWAWDDSPGWESTQQTEYRTCLQASLGGGATICIGTNGLQTSLNGPGGTSWTLNADGSVSIGKSFSGTIPDPVLPIVGTGSVSVNPKTRMGTARVGAGVGLQFTTPSGDVGGSLTFQVGKQFPAGVLLPSGGNLLNSLFSSPSASPPYPPPTSFPNWPSWPSTPNPFPVWTKPGMSTSVSGGYGNVASGGQSFGGDSGAARLVMDENAPKGGPQKLGGISFRGIGAALNDLGPLQGITIDGNGRLVLLAADNKDVQLPPLRLEDVAVIFRAAYRQGEAPFVSIDPDPNAPHGPHRIRHSPGTEQTYVGWVLFEVDRLMKVYGIGRDNFGAREAIHLNIPGYKNIPERDFENQDAEEKNADKRDLWVRKWIVPASVTRRQAARKQLTLLDVPLTVDLVTEVRAGGKFTELPDTRPPRAELDYARWFAEHIDDMGREVLSTPPRESGMTQPVPVFLELRRIALIAAMAEQLRDQGVPLPAWLRDYPVKPFPMPTTMPEASNKVVFRKSGGTVTFSPFGGAVMSPSPDRIRSVPSPEADALAGPVLAAVQDAPSFHKVQFQHEGRAYQAVALPGDDTQGLGACTLEETDLVVPLGAGRDIRLQRRFNSFHRPADVFDGAWSLDLPRMEVFRRIQRTEGKTRYFHKLLQLDSPLGTWCDFFAKEGQVEVPGYSSALRLNLPRNPVQLLGARVEVDRENPGNDNGVPVLYFRDGRRWYFDPEGYLAREHEGPVTIAYHRDAKHRLIRIEGSCGAARAHIDLKYDELGRVREAVGSAGGKVSYQYDPDGLAEVRRPAGVVGYRYKDGLVTGMLRDGKPVRHFEYTPQGELRADRQGDGTKWVQQRTVVPEGTQIITSCVDRPQEKLVMVYDRQLRPLKKLTPDGGRMEWKYGDGEEVSLTITPARGEPLSVHLSADGRRQTWHLPTGGTVRTDYDPAGRPQALFLGKAECLRLAYRHDGQVTSIAGETFVLRPSYGEDGVQTATQLLSPEAAAGKRGPWLQLDFNAQDRPTRITDSQGGIVRARYDAKDRLESVESPAGEMKLRYDDKGRLTGLDAPGGLSCEKSFDAASGQLQRIQVSRGGTAEVMEFDRGLPVRTTKFDRSQTQLDYEAVGEAGRRLRSIRLPNGLTLAYEYNDEGQLAAVNCEAIYRLAYTYDDAGRMVGWKMTPLQGPRGPWQ